MSSENVVVSKHEDKSIRESLESMSNTELAHQLLIIFQKNFKKLFEEADENNSVYKIMNYVIDLDEIINMEDYTDFENIVLDVSWSRSKDIQQNFDLTETVDIENKKIISILLLYKLINSMSKNIENISTLELEYLTHVKIIYELLLSDSSLSHKDVENLSKNYQSYELYRIAENLIK